MLKAMRMCFENLLIFELLFALISTLALLFLFFILKRLEGEGEEVSAWAYQPLELTSLLPLELIELVEEYQQLLGFMQV